MFTDTVHLKLSAGRGGNGVVAWRREPFVPKGGPAGGNGGLGGSIFIEVDESIDSLDYFRNRRLIKGNNGKQGGKGRKNGSKGAHITLKVPPGTLVKEEGRILLDLTTHGEKHLLCEGGKGGLGNAFFKTSTNQAPNKSTPGKAGEERTLELELKCIADVGLVGFPNAGKTTLLSALTDHAFKTGAYPFTTLSPNLGKITFEDYSTLTIADIPGIIEDAHKNRGLGLDFLRHIERCGALLFVLDASSPTLIDEYNTLLKEIGSHSPALLEKPTLIALNKTDLCTPDFPHNHIAISAKESTNLSSLLTALRNLLA